MIHLIEEKGVTHFGLTRTIPQTAYSSPIATALTPSSSDETDAPGNRTPQAAFIGIELIASYGE
jgi:hypothetical protein